MPIYSQEKNKCKIRMAKDTYRKKFINQQTKQKVVVKDDDKCEWYIAPIAAS